MKRFLCAAALVFLCMPAFAGEGLVGMLTSQVSGVSADQAAGGAGAIFAYAKEELSIDDFKKVHEAVPEMDSLLAAAPEHGSVIGDGGLPGMASNVGEGAGGMGAIAGSFDQLGLRPDMISQFTPVVLDYVKQGGGMDTMNLLKGVLQ